VVATVRASWDVEHENVAALPQPMSQAVVSSGQKKCQLFFPDSPQIKKRNKPTGCNPWACREAVEPGCLFCGSPSAEPHRRQAGQPAHRQQHQRARLGNAIYLNVHIIVPSTPRIRVPHAEGQVPSLYATLTSLLACR